MVAKEQKKALSLLIISKAFERLAFYMFIAVFIFYLNDSLNMQIEQAGEFYSLFYLSLGLSTLLFGLIGDFVNRRNLVKLGMSLMTILYLVLIFLPVSLDMQKVIFIALGICIGINVPNTIVFLGNIYNEKKVQVLGLSGFLFFSLAINFGAYLGKGLSNAIREVIGLEPIFILAFIFAVISLVLYLFFDSKYSKLELFAEQSKSAEPEYKNINLIILVSIFIIGVIMKTVLYQKGLTLNQYIRDYVSNGHDLSSRLHNIDERISILILLVFGIIVGKLKNLNWNKLFKLLLIGSIVSSLVYIILGLIGDNNGVKVNSIFTLNMYFVLLLFETIISTIILYSIYRAAPIKYKGLVVGLSLYIFSIVNKFLFVGSTVYENIGLKTFYGFSFVFIVSAVLIIVLIKIVNNKEKKLEEPSS